MEAKADCACEACVCALCGDRLIQDGEFKPGCWVWRGSVKSPEDDAGRDFPGGESLPICIACRDKLPPSSFPERLKHIANPKISDIYDELPAIERDSVGGYRMPNPLAGFRVLSIADPVPEELWLVQVRRPDGADVLRSGMNSRARLYWTAADATYFIFGESRMTITRDDGSMVEGIEVKAR